MASNPALASRARCALAVCGVMPAARASSAAVSARPSISGASMLARAGSPTRAAVSAKAAVLGMAYLFVCWRQHSGAGRRMLRPRAKHRAVLARQVAAANEEVAMDIAPAKQDRFFGWHVAWA